LIISIRRSRFDLVRLENAMGLGFRNLRSGFDLVGVGNAIGFLFLGICDRALIWLGLKMRSGFGVWEWAIAL